MRLICAIILMVFTRIKNCKTRAKIWKSFYTIYNVWLIKYIRVLRREQYNFVFAALFMLWSSHYYLLQRSYLLAFRIVVQKLGHNAPVSVKASGPEVVGHTIIWLGARNCRNFAKCMVFNVIWNLGAPNREEFSKIMGFLLKAYISGATQCFVHLLLLRSPTNSSILSLTTRNFDLYHLF